MQYVVFTKYSGRWHASPVMSLGDAIRWAAETEWRDDVVVASVQLLASGALKLEVVP